MPGEKTIGGGLILKINLFVWEECNFELDKKVLEKILHFVFILCFWFSAFRFSSFLSFLEKKSGFTLNIQIYSDP